MKLRIVTSSYNEGQFIERVVFDGDGNVSTVEIFRHFSSPVRWMSKKDMGQTDAVIKASAPLMAKSSAGSRLYAENKTLCVHVKVHKKIAKCLEDYSASFRLVGWSIMHIR